MPSIKLCLRSVAILMGMLGSVTSSFAQGVIDRPRPDYDPIGVPLGGFQLFPSIALDVSHDDNVFRIQRGTRGDIFVQLAPDLLLKSNWSQHMLNFQAGLQTYQYSNLSTESRTDWNVAATGRLDVQRGSEITGQASYQATHEARASPDQPGSAAKPTPYTLMHAQSGFAYRPFRLGFDAGVLFDRYKYDLTPLVGGGRLDNHDRDRDAWQAFARAIYEFSPGYATFLKATYDERSFDLKQRSDGLKP